ncbi:MAG: PQQ-dependent sugar dehydrogenase, partial [Bacteroidota bacterium]
VHRYELQEAFGNYKGTGITIHGNYLYASSDVAVYRYELSPDQLLPVNPEGEVMIEGFPEQQTHASKSLAVDPAGHMFVTVGAPSNACQEESRTKGSPGIDPCPQLELQAGVWRFDLDKMGQKQGDGMRYATGIRNIVGLDWNANTNGLFVMQHGRDQLSGLWPDYYTDEESALLPSEELLQVDEGDDFGWPYCYYDQFKDQKMLAPEYGGDSEKTGRCEGIEKPVQAFPGHMAPNDLLFYTASSFPERFHQGAFIAFHGSWNRAPEPQGGYFVAFVPMKDGQVTGEWKPFAEGFPGIEVVKSPRDAEYRPMGLALTPKGDLLVADSRKGRIWRIYHTGDVQ